MSTPAGIGVYLSSGVQPANVSDRPWRGVYHHCDGSSDSLGEELRKRVLMLKGNLAAVAREVIDAAPQGWSSLSDQQPLDADEPEEIGPDTGNTCWVYLFDLDARRMDVFSTHADANGERSGSITFDAAGNSDPLVITEPTAKWLSAPLEVSWASSREADLILRRDVERRLTRDCAEAGFSVATFFDHMSKAVSDVIVAAPWPASAGAPTRLLISTTSFGGPGFWRVRLGAVELDYPIPAARSDFETKIDGSELLRVFRPEGTFVTLDVRRSRVAAALGEKSQTFFNILLSAFPTARWLYALLDLIRATQIPEPPPEVAVTPPWKVFTHTDGRHWAIRVIETGYMLRLGDPTDEPVIRHRQEKDAAGAVNALIKEQLADGFVPQADEPV